MATVRPANPARNDRAAAFLALESAGTREPPMTTDPLSAVLRAVRLTGAVFFHVDASSPWVAETPAASAIAARIMPESQHLISYHAVTRGECWGGTVGEPAVRVATGDIIVFPHGDPHVMSSTPGMRAAPRYEMFRRPADQALPFELKEGGGGAEGAHLVCGFLGCDARPFNPLLATLPRVLHVSQRAAEDSWLSQFFRAAVAESSQRRAGGEAMLARLSELMFVEVVRRHLESLPSEQTGWLAGLRDPFVGRALGLLHARPAEAWTLDTLGKEVGLSRSALAENFSALVGLAPIQYLTRWRMQLAAGRLGDGASVGEAAADVGYGSEAAFSRAFKKLVGVPPASWRKQRGSRT
jgi:AraC-like DNA-binding protein